MTTRSAIGKRSGPRRSGRLWPAHDDRWIRYVDGHAALDAMRTELAFNVGVEVGPVWARADLGRRYGPRRARPALSTAGSNPAATRSRRPLPNSISQRLEAA